MPVEGRRRRAALRLLFGVALPPCGLRYRLVQGQTTPEDVEEVRRSPAYAKALARLELRERRRHGFNFFWFLMFGPFYLVYYFAKRERPID